LETPCSRASRRAQGPDAHVRGPARALRRGPLKLRGRPFGPALRHPETTSRTWPRRPRLDGPDQRLSDQEREGPRNPHWSFPGFHPRRGPPPARPRAPGDRRYARPGHGLRFGRVPRALPLARVRLRGHRGPDADGARREAGHLQYRPRPLRYDAVFSNVGNRLQASGVRDLWRISWRSSLKRGVSVFKRVMTNRTRQVEWGDSPVVLKPVTCSL
jgi:hypothetical protein